MNLFDLLAGVGQMGVGGQAVSDAQPGPSGADPNAATQVQGLTVTAPRSHPAANAQQNIFNAANNASEQNAYMQIPQGYAPHTGMFGIHGNLRNIIGVLGDAFLARNGKPAEYMPQYMREKEADALAGYTTDPDHAINRLMATGAPGSADLAERLNQSHWQQIYHQDIAESLAQSRQARVDDLQDRKDQRGRDAIGGLLLNAYRSGDPKVWEAARQQALMRGKKISDFDPDIEVPEDMHNYLPGYGMSANQVQLSADRQRGQDVGYQGRVAAARAGANARGAQPSLQHTYGEVADKVAQVGVAGLSPGEREVWNAGPGAPKRGASSYALPPGLNPQGGQPQGGPPQQAPQRQGLQPGSMHNGYQVFTPEQARSAAQNPSNRGKKFYTTDGRLIQL